MPKRLPARFDSSDECCKCQRLRKLCNLCNRCDKDCKCLDMPYFLERRLDDALSDLRKAIHKIAILEANQTPEKVIDEEEVYQALSKINFEELMSHHFHPPLIMEKPEATP